MKKIAFALGSGALASSAFAQEAGDFASSLSAAATGAINDATASITPVLLAAFAITVAFLVYKLIKRAVNKA